jgi:hypothetical protein
VSENAAGFWQEFSPFRTTYSTDFTYFLFLFIFIYFVSFHLKNSLYERESWKKRKMKKFQNHGAVAPHIAAKLPICEVYDDVRKLCHV